MTASTGVGIIGPEHEFIMQYVGLAFGNTLFCFRRIFLTSSKNSWFRAPVLTIFIICYFFWCCIADFYSINSF